MREVQHLLGIRCKLGEGPLWQAEEQALYWVDIDNQCFYRWRPDESGSLARYDVGLPVGALAFRAGGGLVLATKQGFAFWDESSQALEFIADPEADKPQSRFNDGAVDGGGRFWAGTMGDGRHNALYRLDPDGQVHQMETGVIISNGIGWSPDGRTMYYTDSPRQTIYAYAFEAETGEISNRRVLVHDPERKGYPDGLTVDSEGYIWSARWEGWCLHRYDPAGKLVEKIEMPVEFPTSCVFGGPEMDELFITSAWTALGEARKDEQPMSGDLFRLKAGVRGMAEPKFGG